MVPPVSPRKALAMIISQQTTSLSDQAREADGVREVSFDIHTEAKAYSPLPMTIPFSERLSEQWLLERTYHAQLRNGRELSVPALTKAMKQLIDFDVPLSTQSSKSELPERVPLKKSSNFSVPLSTWREITPAEASATFQQGIPVLLYGEHAWEHAKGAFGTWSANRNMRVIISGNAGEHAEAVSGIDYAVCYLDPQRGTFSNAAWRACFASDPATILDGNAPSPIIFLGPWMSFPYTTHYTVIASDGQIHEYADSAGAMQGFQTLPPREASSGSRVQTVFPQFCYYHEVTFPSGVYRIEFFGPRMDERGYQVKEAA